VLRKRARPPAFGLSPKLVKHVFDRISQSEFAGVRAIIAGERRHRRPTRRCGVVTALAAILALGAVKLFVFRSIAGAARNERQCVDGLWVGLRVG